LSVARTAVLENKEMQVEGEHVDGKGDEDETKDAESEMGCQFDLQLLAQI
jgi:hypothetical protein